MRGSRRASGFMCPITDHRSLLSFLHILDQRVYQPMKTFIQVQCQAKTPCNLQGGKAVDHAAQEDARYFLTGGVVELRC